MFRLIWLCFLNLGIFALAICVLAGCQSPAENNYSLINWNTKMLTLIWGQECTNATSEFIPNLYKMGSSGVCRVFDNEVTCSGHFPPDLNLAQAVLEDIDKFNSTDPVIQKCRETIDKPINHSTAKKIGIALACVIFLSMLLGVISTLVAVKTDEPWGWGTSPVLVFDAITIFVALVLLVAIMNYEGGGYLKHVHAREYSDKEMIGIGLWLLLGMFIARMLSNPWVLAGVITILVPIFLAVGFVLIRFRGFMMFM
ncbi:hypothetical protein V2G26_005371 [Clonostachys chloroleuca]